MTTSLFSGTDSLGALLGGSAATVTVAPTLESDAATLFPATVSGAFDSLVDRAMTTTFPSTIATDTPAPALGLDVDFDPSLEVEFDGEPDLDPTFDATALDDPGLDAEPAPQDLAHEATVDHAPEESQVRDSRPMTRAPARTVVDREVHGQEAAPHSAFLRTPIPGERPAAPASNSPAVIHQDVPQEPTLTESAATVLPVDSQPTPLPTRPSEPVTEFSPAHPVPPPPPVSDAAMVAAGMTESAPTQASPRPTRGAHHETSTPSPTPLPTKPASSQPAPVTDRPMIRPDSDRQRVATRTPVVAPEVQPDPHRPAPSTAPTTQAAPATPVQPPSSLQPITTAAQPAAVASPTGLVTREPWTDPVDGAEPTEAPRTPPSPPASWRSRLARAREEATNPIRTPDLDAAPSTEVRPPVAPVATRSHGMVANAREVAMVPATGGTPEPEATPKPKANGLVPTPPPLPGADPEREVVQHFGRAGLVTGEEAPRSMTGAATQPAFRTTPRPEEAAAPEQHQGEGVRTDRGETSKGSTPAPIPERATQPPNIASAPRTEPAKPAAPLPPTPVASQTIPEAAPAPQPGARPLPSTVPEPLQAIPAAPVTRAPSSAAVPSAAGASQTPVTTPETTPETPGPASASIPRPPRVEQVELANSVRTTSASAKPAEAVTPPAPNPPAHPSGAQPATSRREVPVELSSNPTVTLPPVDVPRGETRKSSTESAPGSATQAPSVQPATGQVPEPPSQPTGATPSRQMTVSSDGAQPRVGFRSATDSVPTAAEPSPAAQPLPAPTFVATSPSVPRGSGTVVESAPQPKPTSTAMPAVSASSGQSHQPTEPLIRHDKPTTVPPSITTQAAPLPTQAPEPVRESAEPAIPNGEIRKPSPAPAIPVDPQQPQARSTIVNTAAGHATTSLGEPASTTLSREQPSVTTQSARSTDQARAAQPTRPFVPTSTNPSPTASQLPTAPAAQVAQVAQVAPMTATRAFESAPMPASGNSGTAAPTPASEPAPAALTPAPATPGPASSAPASSAPATPAPATPAPATPAPATPAPATSAPATSAPATSAPATQVARTSGTLTSAVATPGNRTTASVPMSSLRTPSEVTTSNPEPARPDPAERPAAVEARELRQGSVEAANTVRPAIVRPGATSYPTNPTSVPTSTPVSAPTRGPALATPAAAAPIGSARGQTEIPSAGAETAKLAASERAVAVEAREMPGNSAEPASVARPTIARPAPPSDPATSTPAPVPVGERGGAVREAWQQPNAPTIQPAKPGNGAETHPARPHESPPAVEVATQSAEPVRRRGEGRRTATAGSGQPRPTGEGIPARSTTVRNAAKRPDAGWWYSSMQAAVTPRIEVARGQAESKAGAESGPRGEAPLERGEIRMSQGKGSEGSTSKAEVALPVGTETKSTGPVPATERSWEARPESTLASATRSESSGLFKVSTLAGSASPEIAKVLEEQPQPTRREEPATSTATVPAGASTEGAIPSRGVVPTQPVDSTKNLEDLGNHLGNGTRVGGAAPAVVAGEVDGTVAAGLSSGMRRGGKQDKSAGNGVQKLPGTADVHAGAASPVVSTGDAGVRRAQPLKDGPSEVMVDEASLILAARGRDEKTRGGLGLAGEVTPASEARLQKMEELISKEVVRFRWSGQESVSVTIRPEEGTEVVVHLRQREGQMEAMLGMARGEAARFNGHWQQLHDALAEQNVRLLPGRESAQALNPAGAGANLNMGTGSGSGSGSGPGGNPSPGNQSGAGAEWRDTFGGAADERSADRRRVPDLAAIDGERPVTRGTTPGRRPVRSVGPVGRPEGWEFWA
jgi:hypothetical protein